MIKPFSDNIIFLDTEFSSLNPYKGEIVSIGLVKLTGEELYLELEYDGEWDTWPRENILPTLKSPKVNRETSVKIIKEFVGDKKPFTISYVNQFDTIYTYKLFGIDNHPFYWMPLDFPSMLFGMGIDPEDYFKEDVEFYQKLGIDKTKYINHNALDDAKQLREVYLKFIESKK